MANVKRIVKEAQDSGKYVIAVTFVDPKTGILEHRIEMYQFPNADLQNAFSEMEKLARKNVDINKEIGRGI